MTKREKKAMGIRGKIFIYLTVFSAIILLFLWLFQVVFLDGFYKFTKITEIKLAAERISEHINDENLQDYVEYISEDNGLCVLILRMASNTHGYREISSHTQDMCAIHNTVLSSRFIKFAEAMQNGGELMQQYVYDQNTHSYQSVDASSKKIDAPESIIYSVVTVDKDGETMFIVLNSTVTPIFATRRTILYMLSIVSVLMIAMADGGSYLISKKVSKPIVSINNAAKKLAARNYQQNFSENAYREVSELGDTLNYASKELSKVDDMCRELIANISHDLRTPLTMIKGYAEVMRDLPDENTPENVQIIVDEANRLTTLVNDVLDISHFQSGKQKFERVPFNLTQTVIEAVDRYSALNARNGYTIDFINESGIDAWVLSDETRILQVLYNLLNNAITYTGDDKSITVRQIVHDGLVRIEITDTGEGIEPDHINEIWERYYKIDKNHKRATIGSGLGLPIVKQIMRLAGGGCGVRSKVGCGSTFYFEMPMTIKKSEE